MIGKVFPATDDSWLVKRTQPHCLSFVKLRILKSRKPQQPIQHAGWKALLLDVEEIGPDHLDYFRKGAFDGPLPLLSGWWQVPRVSRISVLVTAAPHANEITLALGCRNQLTGGLGRNPLQVRQECPLVAVRSKLGIDEDAVACIPWNPLQR